MSSVCESEKTIRLANVRLHDLTFDEIIELSERTIAGKASSLFVVTLDIIGAYKSIFDAEYHDCIMNCDLVTCDGAGMKLLSMMKYPRHIKNKVSGVDLAARLLRLADEKKYRVAFIGSREETIKKLEEKITAGYPGIAAPFFHDGYFDARGFSSIVARLAGLKPDIIFFGLGNPAQEKAINSVRRIFPGAVMIGVGGSFDVMSGVLKRAPLIMQKLYIEWLYRLWQEPSRIFRMLNIPKYIIYAVICEALKWTEK